MGYERDSLNYKSKYTVDAEDKVLRNKLGIWDEDGLNEAERMITSYKLAKLYLETGAQTFDSEHLKSIHKFLFEDIYPFAGEFRRENISKRITFCLVQYIEPELDKTLKKAIKMVPKLVDRDTLLRYITELYSDLDMIHPFREGNGRTEREFMRQYIDFVCKKNNLPPYYLAYNLIDDRDAYIDAIVKADALCSYGDLMVLFDRILLVREKDKTIGEGPKL